MLKVTPILIWNFEKKKKNFKISTNIPCKKESVSSKSKNLIEEVSGEKMSNSTAETLENERDDKISNVNQRTEPSQEWETMARAWVTAFPDAKAVVSGTEVETWIGSNFDSLPADLRHMPRSELVDRLLSIQHYMRPTPSDQNEVRRLSVSNIVYDDI